MLAVLTLPDAIHMFFTDTKTQVALVMVSLDFLLGVLAAVKQNQFTLAWIADLARTDILYKLLPWSALYLGALYAGGQQLLIPGFDIGAAATTLYALIVATWAASITKSLHDLGLPLPGVVSGVLGTDQTSMKHS